MENNILKGEVYSKLRILLKHFYVLINHEFPTNGSQSFCKLIIDIIEKIKSRFHLFTTKQLKHVSNFIQSLEGYCGYLNESEISKVPWSIIPALEKLFQNIMPSFQFAIGPIWESNYKIFNKNILEHFRDQIISIPGLLFDADDSFQENTEKFITNYPAGIYLIYFPRIEKKSALHFALLGHEIGHSFSQKWLKKNFTDFIKKNELVEKFKKIAEKKFNDFESSSTLPLFTEVFSDMQTQEYQRVTSRILRELLADVYGAYLFGETSIVASYLFSLKSNIDNTQGWKSGYLSWRFRLHFINHSLNFIFSQNDIEKKIPKSNWNNSIQNCLSNGYLDGNDPYLDEILQAIENEKDFIFNDMMDLIDNQLFSNFINEDQIAEAQKRLKDKITPNSFFDGEIEHPIELRNILYATWIELGELINLNFNDYEQKSIIINLLSIKGIELSIEQEKFNDIIKGRPS